MRYIAVLLVAGCGGSAFTAAIPQETVDGATEASVPDAGANDSGGAESPGEPDAGDASDGTPPGDAAQALDALDALIPEVDAPGEAASCPGLNQPCVVTKDCCPGLYCWPTTQSCQ